MLKYKKYSTIVLILFNFINWRVVSNNITNSAKKKISKEALARLQELPWTGNIRELRNVVERLVILGETTISLEDVKKYADY